MLQEHANKINTSFYLEIRKLNFSLKTHYKNKYFKKVKINLENKK